MGGDDDEDAGEAEDQGEQDQGDGRDGGVLEGGDDCVDDCWRRGLGLVTQVIS